MSDLLLKDLNSLQGFFTDPIFVAEDATAQSTAPAETKSVDSTAEIFVQPEERIQFNLVGAYQKGLLILINDTKHDVSNDEGKTLLKNILKFLKINSEDFGILNLRNYPEASFEQIKLELNPNKVLAFGIDHNFLGHDTSENYFKKEGISFFLGSALPIMATDVDSKKMFNQSLKNYTP